MVGEGRRPEAGDDKEQRRTDERNVIEQPWRQNNVNEINSSQLTEKRDAQRKAAIRGKRRHEKCGNRRRPTVMEDGRTLG
ncbi:hypothetical protein M5689_016721 [Euphorbia peplus]|nr:hypothetical protein M5689_016721 [Euphorbia peplus]